MPNETVGEVRWVLYGGLFLTCRRVIGSVSFSHGLLVKEEHGAQVPARRDPSCNHKKTSLEGGTSLGSAMLSLERWVNLCHPGVFLLQHELPVPGG